MSYVICTDSNPLKINKNMPCIFYPLSISYIYKRREEKNKA